MKLQILFFTLSIFLLLQCSTEQEAESRNLEPENFIAITSPCRDTLFNCSIVQTPKETLIRFTRTRVSCGENLLLGFNGFDSGTHSGNLIASLCRECGSGQFMPERADETIVIVEEYGDIGQVISGSIFRESGGFSEPDFEGTFRITRIQ